MKTKEELNELKEEVETVSGKLHALPEDELEQVNGGQAGMTSAYCPECGTLLGRWIWIDSEGVHDFLRCRCGWEGFFNQTNKQIEYGW